jgi:hypothetical protein
VELRKLTVGDRRKLARCNRDEVRRLQASVEHDSRQTRQLSDVLTVRIQQAEPDGDLDFQAEAPIHWAFDAVRGCEDLLHRAIILARFAGASWGDIGREVALSRQAAHARWSPAVYRLEAAVLADPRIR